MGGEGVSNPNALGMPDEAAYLPQMGLAGGDIDAGSEL